MNHKINFNIDFEINENLLIEDIIDSFKQKLNDIFLDKIYEKVDVSCSNTSQPIKIAEFCPHDIFSLFKHSKSLVSFKIKDKIYKSRVNSSRYLVFKNNNFCSACGLKGTKMYLEYNIGDNNAHFNFYGIENNKLVLFTIDHFKPISKGGKNNRANMYTCCAICNTLKGNYDLNYEQVKELRRIYMNNIGSLSRKQINKLIRKRREELINTT